MSRKGQSSNEITRRDERTATAGVRCPLGSIVDLSGAGLKALCTTKPSVLIGHALSIHIEAGDRKIDVMGKVIWIKRLGHLKKQWHLGVQFEDPSDEIRHTIMAIAHKCATKPAENGSKEQVAELPMVEATVEDLYAVLGLTPSASSADIREAYRQLAFHWHPDRCAKPEALKVFGRISKAHSVLRDPVTRRRYDDMLSSGRLVA